MAIELFRLPSEDGTESRGYLEDGKIILTETMSGAAVKSLIDANKEQAREDPMAKTRNDDMGILGARIDKVTHFNWRQEWRTTARLWGKPWHKFLQAKLQDPDHKHMTFMKL